jgi:Asp-tRNA(Asn)/Glu-tRNA(Gln) amidotransferase A subunit family amidase
MPEPFRDATELSTAIRNREISPVAVIDDTLERIDALDRNMNSVVVVLRDEALEAAKAAEASLNTGAELGPLHGVPFTVKEATWVCGTPTTNGSLALSGFTPPENAILVRRLRDAGAILVGKTNNPEFCYEGSTGNQVYGLTRNPWDLSRTPGGSSGGAAASVSAGLTPIAMGGDAGGSIRIPGAFCGVPGFKPTFGLIPQGPGFPSWKTLLTHGPLARTVQDLALCLQAVAGPDPTDDLSLPRLGIDYVDRLETVEPNGRRVAYSVDLGFAPVEPAVKQCFLGAVERLRKAGWQLEASHPETEDPSAIYSVICYCEQYACEGHLLEQSRDKIADHIVEMIEAGQDLSGAEYVQAQHERAGYTRLWSEFFEHFDLLLTPTMPMVAFSAGMRDPQILMGQELEYPEASYCALCLPPNLTKQPALTMPCGLDSRDGLPVGLQVIGPWAHDEAVLAAGRDIERLLGPTPNPTPERILEQDPLALDRPEGC